jgi:hypothetical protein
MVQLEHIGNAFAEFRKLPLLMQIVVGATAGAFVLNVLIFVGMTAGAGLKIDQGVATLCGATIGIIVVGWQTNKGFKNLIRSQESQAAHERDARVHQANLDQEAKDKEEAREKRALTSALWAEVYSLHDQAHNAWINAQMMNIMYKGMIESGQRSTAKTFAFPTFEAPIYREHVSRLGLLGASLAADVVLVLSMATGKQATATLDSVIPHELLATLYEGHADKMKGWREDLYHVAARLSASTNNTADPGTLWDNRQKRKAEVEKK